MDSAARLTKDDEVSAFERDGATCMRGLLDQRWITRMRDAIEQALGDRDAAFDERMGFYNGFFHWRRNPTFRDFIFNSPLADVAARFLRAQSVNFFYDQLMVKEQGRADRTPWHIDSTYFPTTGGKTLSIWVPFDHASPASGTVTYFKGSHRWVRERGRAEVEAFLGGLPDPGTEIPKHAFLAWTLEPGDVLIHDVDTLHGAAANRSTNRRRALATRWTDQDVRYAPRPDDFFATARAAGLTLPEVPLTPGAMLTSDLFPCVWPRGAQSRS